MADSSLRGQIVGLRGHISGLRGQISGLREQISGLKGLMGDRRANGRTDGQTKVPLFYRTLSSLELLPKRDEEEEKIPHVWKSIGH